MTAAKKLSDQLERLVGDDDLQVPGLGVVVFKGGVEVFSKFIGRRTINPARPVTRRTRFRAASLSKMFTAFTLMQLVERGRLNLDDDVSNYLGFELRNPLFPQKKNYRPNAGESHVIATRRKNLLLAAYSQPPRIFSPRRKVLGKRSTLRKRAARKVLLLLQLELRRARHIN
ncbi:MAG: beta-lactamase family protein [Selenomonadaceae bacterium]|nr:beta-lactamase family protein [Selenomonadaceae bacterium]